MDFVDEQDVALLQIGEQRGEIAGLGDHRPRGGAEIDAQLARDDLRQRGLAEARRADEQHVIERFVARPCRLDEDRKIGARLLLADELGQPLRPQRGLGQRPPRGARRVTRRRGGVLKAQVPRSRLYLFGMQFADADRFRAVASRHDDARVAIVVPDQLAAGAAGRHHRDRSILFLGRRMAHGDDGFDAELTGDGDRLAERNRLGADRHAAEIGIETDAGENLAGARAQRGADLLPVVAIALADRLGRGLDQCAVGFAQSGLRRHLESSFSPSRINCAVSAPSPAFRLAAEIAAAACGWP